ncbi:MarR family transcriptional regulator [uncultured Arthrobacter sp.]|uniref:MarR family transcriptional regulator n=1 Tax=uncultured Arthrobacter sp. TaxID=114050 RepID=UPI0028D38A4B|nr:MarR family transcriptional regulator [uncultured Arthrobacter sp.]
MYVLTIDQRGSTNDVDRVPELLEALGAHPGVRFERSVGDEVQGVLQDPALVVDVALHALRSGHWYVGIGVGPGALAPDASPREGSGPAFVAARRAVERAKSAASHVPAAVVAGTREREAAAACANAEAVLRLVGRLVQDRTEAQWRVVDALRAKSGAAREQGPGRHGLQKQVARDLGISEQSVSRTVLRSGWQEEWAARPAVEMLLATAHRLVLKNLAPGAQDGDDNTRGAP